MASIIEDQKTRAGEKKVIKYPVVDLKGSPREIGRQLGEARRATVRMMLLEVKSNLIAARVPFGTGMTESELIDEVRRYMRAIGEPTELPAQAPARASRYWASRALRRRELGDAAA